MKLAILSLRSSPSRVRCAAAPAAPLTAAGRWESAPPGREGPEENNLLVLLVIGSPPKNSASVAETPPPRRHRTAVRSTLLPWPRAQPPGRGAAEGCGVDPRPPTNSGAGDGPARSDSGSPVPLTPIAAVASGSASPAYPIPTPPRPHGALPARSSPAAQISSGARPCSHLPRSARDRHTGTTWRAC